MERRKARLADVTFKEHHVSGNTLHIQHSSQQVTAEYTPIFRCADRATQIPTDSVRGIAVRGKVLKVRMRLQALPFRVSDLTSEAHTLSTVTAFLLKPDGDFSIVLVNVLWRQGLNARSFEPSASSSSLVQSTVIKASLGTFRFALLALRYATSYNASDRDLVVSAV